MIQRQLHKILALCLALSIISSCTKDGDGPGDRKNSPISLDCFISSDLMLSDHNEDGIDYIVDCNVEVQSGTLQIEPGTHIQFKEGSSLTISSGATIKAEGISGNPILMEGTSNNPSWRGLYIASSSGRNILDHVTIDGAGDGENFGLFTSNHAAVTFQGRLSMTNTTITNSGDHGIYSEENLSESILDAFENNTITRCRNFPILVSQNLIEDMKLPTCTFTENGRNMVGMHQEVFDRLQRETTLEAIDIPYYIQEGFELYAGLTLEAGVELVMGNGSYISSTSPQNQFLLIQGTPSNHVTIRGEEALSGYWQGIYLTVPNPKNIWDYLDLSDGGSSVQGFNSTPAHVTLEREANLTINNCTMARSGSSCDIVLSTFFEMPTLVNNSPDIGEVCTE